MSIPMNARCYVCHLGRNTQIARSLAGDEAADQVARGLVQEHLADTYFLNQVETEAALQDANIMASILKPQGFSMVAGSQRKKLYHVL